MADTSRLRLGRTRLAKVAAAWKAEECTAERFIYRRAAIASSQTHWIAGGSFSSGGSLRHLEVSAVWRQ